MAVPTWVAAGSKTQKPSSSGNTSTVAPPAGHATGDLLVIAADIYVSGTLVTLATPAGWTLLAQSPYWGADGYHRAYLFWKLAASGSEPSVTLTTSAGAFCDSQMYAFRGVYAAAPIDASAGFGTESKLVANVAVPALTTLSADTLMVFVGFATQNPAWVTPPAGATERIETGAYIAVLVVATEPKPTAGLEAADIYTRSGSSGETICAAFAVASQAVANPSGTMSKIKWGDDLAVTDEGAGVIRVDGTLPQRLANVTAQPPGNDCDNAVESGWYAIQASSANAPPGSEYYALFVVNINYTQHVRQIAYAWTTDQVWERRRVTNVWSAWFSMSKAQANGLASLDASAKLPAAQLPDLTATYQTRSEKAVANGYASLDSGGKVPAAQLPATLPGTELAYAQITASKTVTATAETVADLVVSAPAVTFDGSTVALIEFFARSVLTPASGGANLSILLYLDGASLGHLAQANTTAAASGQVAPVYAARRLTPAAGSRQYSIAAIVSSGTGTVHAGPGGVGQVVPAFVRITRV